jgi:glycosyltransferase involved in cell wall biosynthesis
LRRVWFPSRKVALLDGLDAYYLPFINLNPIKTLSLGLANVVSLLQWGWRYRHVKNKAIITYNVHAPHGLTTVFAARILRTKAFAVIADLPVPGHGIVPSTFMRRLEFALQIKSLPWFDGLVVLTRDMAEDFAPQVPFIWMEGAIDQSIMKLADEELSSEMQHQFTVMYAGALTEFDGVLQLLDAFSLLNESWYRLVIAGKGALEVEVRHAASRDARISYLGFLPHEEVVMLYQGADVLVNPRPSTPLSTRYVFPSKLIEYLATGKAVISTATSGVQEEYADFLFLLEDETPEGLANLIRQIARLSPAERRAKGTRAREHVLANKNWEAQGGRVAGFIWKHAANS